MAAAAPPLLPLDDLPPGVIKHIADQLIADFGTNANDVPCALRLVNRDVRAALNEPAYRVIVAKQPVPRAEFARQLPNRADRDRLLVARDYMQPQFGNLPGLCIMREYDNNKNISAFKMCETRRLYFLKILCCILLKQSPQTLSVNDNLT